MPRRRRLPLTLRRSHRWLGVGLALPLVLLAVTGVLLNHSDDLGLDQRFATQPWLAGLYGIDPKVPDSGYRIGEHWVSHARDTLFLDGRELTRSHAAPVGAAMRDGLLVVASADTLYLFTSDGRTVDQLAVPPDHRPIQALAVVGQRVLARTPSTVLTTNTQLTRWRETDQPWPGNSTPQPLPPSRQVSIRQHLLASSLSWERVLLELHSGRILGSFGPWLADLAAVVMIMLAVTGGVMWLRVALRRNQK